MSFNTHVTSYKYVRTYRKPPMADQITQQAAQQIADMLKALGQTKTQFTTFNALMNDVNARNKEEANNLEKWYRGRVALESKESKLNLAKLKAAQEQYKILSEEVNTRKKQTIQLEAELKKLNTNTSNLNSMSIKELNSRKVRSDQLSVELKRLNEETQKYQVAAEQMKNGAMGVAANIKTLNFKGLTERIQDNVKQFVENKATLAAFGDALKRAYQDARSTLVKAGGVFESSSSVFSGYFSHVVDAIKLGLSPQDLAQITAVNRQVILAMGGQAKVLNMVNSAYTNQIPILEKYRARGLDGAEALSVITSQMTQLGKMGIKPTQQRLNELADETFELSKRTGMSASALSSLYGEVLNDVDFQHTMRAVQEDQRDAILKSTRAMVANNVALGMSAEQAKEAAKMLSKMVAARPLERIKQAARIRALGSAFGIAGGEEAAAAVQRGGRTPEDRKSIENFSKSAADFADASKEQGIGMELAVDTLLEKLDLNQYYGKGSPFSDTLASVMKPQNDALNALKDGQDQGLGKVLGAIDSAGTLISTPIVAAIGIGTLGIIRAIMAKGVSGNLPGFGDIGGKGGGVGGGKGGGRLSKMKGSLSKFFGMSGAIGSAAFPAVNVTNEMMGSLAGATTTGAESIEKTAGKQGAKSLGKGLLKKIPGIGLLAGLAFGANRAMGGDWTGAGLEVASGAASTIPGVGTAASVGIDVALAARDIKKSIDEQGDVASEKQQEAKTVNNQNVEDHIKHLSAIVGTIPDKGNLTNIASLIEEHVAVSKQTLAAVMTTAEERAKGIDIKDRVSSLRNFSAQYKAIV